MRAVKARDTGPELIVRRLVYGMGYRYRLHQSSLPGKPDIVFSGRRKAIFVHGCFWHGHECSRGDRVPKTNRPYWIGKVARNRSRDATVKQALIDSGWDVLVIWECETRSKIGLEQRIRGFLGDPQTKSPARKAF